jgi:hypothetical protein
MARIDPILTHGCEIMPDIDQAAFRQLELASHAYLRRLLGLNPRSMVCVLYTETGIIPLPYRRAELTLRYLIYLVNLPDRHYVKSALFDSLDLAQSHRSGWAMDLIRSWEKYHAGSFVLLHVPSRIFLRRRLRSLSLPYAGECDAAWAGEITSMSGCAVFCSSAPGMALTPAQCHIALRMLCLSRLL